MRGNSKEIHRASEITLRAIKYELRPNHTQSGLIRQTCGCCRFVYNSLLAANKELYERTGKFLLGLPKMNGFLNKLKAENEFLAVPPSQALQQTLLNLGNALGNFLRHRKTDRYFGFPVFHRKGADESFRIPVNCQINFDKWAIKLPKLGWVRIYKGRNKTIPSEAVHSVTVSFTSTGRYFISVLYEVPPKVKLNNGKAVGVDVGLKSFAVTSDGIILENQKYLRRNLQKLRILQRHASRQYIQGKKKEEQSNNWKKTLERIARLHEKIRFARTDFLHKASTFLASKYSVICVESLNIKGMLRNRKLSQAIGDCGWRTFLTLLKYKADELVEIDKWYPSSQTCSACGYVNPKVRNLTVRSWACPECGTLQDRDLNAARNILREGLSLRERKVSQQTMLAPRTPRL